MTRDFHKLALKNIPNTIFQIFDTEFRVLGIYGEKKLEEAGYVIPEIKGKIIDEAYPPHIVALYKPFWKRAINGHSSTFEMEHEVKDTDTFITWEQIFLPLENDNGKIVAGMVISRDVTTEIKVLEEIKEHQNARYRISEIANHKFRAPVATLDGLLNLISEYRDEMNPELRSLINKMRVPITALYDIITDIHNLSQGISEDFENKETD